jgi:uncharacterized protein involved in exopolysaccharide biosynthesis
VTTMNKTASFFHFIYRIRYWITLFPLLVAILVAIFTARLPRTFEANSTLYTGIASSPNLDATTVTNWFATNNSFDNIINLAKARSTLETVSLKLFAQALIKGDPLKDNTYITSANYNKLRSIVPADVLLLVDTSSIENTFQRFMAYKKEGSNNFIYGLLNWFHPHYSIDALSKIKVNRLGSSDMIQINYSCDDPGIVHQTLRFLIEELDKEYSKLQLGSSNDVVAYFEKQLYETRMTLNALEDSLLAFSMASNVINYEEQTKQLTEAKHALEAKYETAYTEHYTSEHMLIQLESQMKERAALMDESKQFVQQMETISSLSQRIAQLETAINPSPEAAMAINQNKRLLEKAKERLQTLSNSISSTKTTKEGLALQDMVDEWFKEKLNYERSAAQRSILEKRMEDIDASFAQFTPIGPNLKKQEREIQVTEDAYQTLLDHLAQAKLQQKNIEMRSTTINMVTEPIYPLAAVASKRKLIVLLSYFACLFFIFTAFLIIEWLDKTIRDKHRAAHLTGIQAIGAFPGPLKLKYRRFGMEIHRQASAHVCHQLAPHFPDNGQAIIGLISSDPKEGKTHVAEQLKRYWNDRQYEVCHLAHDVDFNSLDKEYFKARTIGELVPPDQTLEADILLVEWPALSQNAIPSQLARSVNAFVYVVKATRAWKDRDIDFLNVLKQQAGSVPIFVCLNWSNLNSVEDFTGFLPPYTRMRTWWYKLHQMELTSDKPVNIDIPPSSTR